MTVTAVLERTCRVCGCTEFDPCPGGCAWAGESLCTACLARAYPVFEGITDVEPAEIARAMATEDADLEEDELGPDPDAEGLTVAGGLLKPALAVPCADCSDITDDLVVCAGCDVARLCPVCRNAGPTCLNCRKEREASTE